MSTDRTGPYVRLATMDDLEELAAMNQHFRGRANQTKFIKFLIRRSWSSDARITVVVHPGGQGRIVASTIWRRPSPEGHTSPSIVSALRMGLLGVIMTWGLGVITVKKKPREIHPTTS
ncbi:hypothetical protein DFH09DRAFT_1085175 [Mycena vulgaris]|nr:hypothetical protein DFH09DRAFT_1085175 [Mycena vulgaris]